MLVADTCCGTLAAILALLAALGTLRVWHVYIVSLIFGGLAGFFVPAYRAAVPDVTSAEALPSANALTSLSVQIARVAGPTLGAIAFAFIGASGAFALNSLSFFVAAACVLPLLGSSRTHKPQQSAFVATNISIEISAGVRFIAQRPCLWMTIMLYCMTNVTLVGPYSVALPVLVQTSLHAGVATLGLLYAAFPAGYILGGLWAGRQGRLRRRGWLIYSGIGIAGLSLCVFGLPIPIAGLVVAALINGAFLQIDNLAWTHILQELVPRELLGRVTSVDELGSSALVPTGIVAVGALTDVLGAPIIFLVGGGLTALVAGLGLLHPAVRKLD
jgi:DHA3 family tetracycline resistance protein-like MFS transporter